MTNDPTQATAPRRRTARTAAPSTLPAATSTVTAVPAAATASKSDTVVKLLLRAKGATPLELIAATDWQPHSVRAFLTGLRKKGRVIVREARKSGPAAYRIVVADEGGSDGDTVPTSKAEASTSPIPPSDGEA